MSYTVPSVLVYQELENAGGVANSTPDLEACIVGPAYNVLRYVPGSSTSLVKTAATSSTSSTGSTVAGSAVVTFATIPPFSEGDDVIISGAADAAGSPLAGKVLSSTGFTITLDTVAGATVAAAAVTKRAILTNSFATNTFNLPGQTAGQVVDSASIQVFANQAKVETISTGFTGYTGSNAITIAAASGTCSASSGTGIITGVTNPTHFREGDTVSIAGAGTAGAALVTKIVTINGSTFDLATGAVTTAAGTTITKISISNVSPVTSTLMVEAGDEVVVDYTATDASAKTFSSTVLRVSAGNLSNITLADMLPADLSVATTSTASIAANATTLTLSSATGFATGDTIVIKGAGVGGGDHEAVIGTLTGAGITGLSPATVTAVTGATAVLKRARFTFKTRKLFNNQVVPAVKPILGGANYSISNVAVDGTITINTSPEVIYGRLMSGTIHIAYKALRTDLSATVLAIADPDDLKGVFGEVSEDNPLALGVSIALQNTTTRVRAIAISTNDTAGYMSALELAEGERVYGLAPLTQEVAVCQAFALHAQGLSTPENALWRVALVNTAIPSKAAVGSFTKDIVNANSGNNFIALSAGKYVLTSTNSTFISDGVTAGDTLNITASSGSTGAIQILEVTSNQQVVVQAAAAASGVSFYITRTLSKTQRAAAVAAMSRSFGDRRVVHVQPDTIVVTVGGRNVVLPGYYLCAALSGLIAGFPSQQGFTNIGIAGVSDLSNSNFTFTRAQMNTMAEAGTFLFVQETSGSLPYVRHELTTDMSVLEYRELQQVKNWDFISYFYHDKMKSFTGRWNITPDTISTVRQTLNASSELLKSKKLPRIGAALTEAVIESLAQNKANKDNLDCRMKIKMPACMNYMNLYLVI